MFKRSETDSRRVLIVDVSHLFYKFAYGAKRLTTVMNVNGVNQVVDTTLPTGVIKAIHRWSKGGIYPTVVCFDAAGSNRSKKAYFAKYNGIREGADPIGYKAGRENQSSTFYQGINITHNLLVKGGVCCLRAQGYEADDLIKAAVDKAKEQYPDLPIDIITGDQDLVPLVDEQVSVFLSSRKGTWAENKDLEKVNYVQLTPDNMQDYMESLTDFKNLIVPYNTVLLKKLLRGKKADEIPGYPKFTPTKYNKLIMSLQEDGYDLSNLVRYEVPKRVIAYVGTGEPIPEELIDSTPTEMKTVTFKEPESLTNLCKILSNYLDEDIINHIRFIYNGVNLNTAYTGLPDQFNRNPARLTADIKGYNFIDLQKVLSENQTQINLPII